MEQQYSKRLQSYSPSGLIGLLLGFIVIAPCVALYSYGGVAGARDLKHLIELALLRRSMS